jgi:hypothetical protein
MITDNNTRKTASHEKNIYIQQNMANKMELNDVESNNEKIHIEKNSVIYEQLKEATKAYSNYKTVEEFIRKEQNSHLYPCDALAVLCGKITVDKKGEIWIEFFQGKKEDLCLVYGGQGNHAYIFRDLDINKLKGLAMSQSKQEIVQDKHCQISCRKTDKGKQSIRINFPAGNHVTFYDDGFCNGENGSYIHFKENSPTKNENFIVYTIGEGKDEITISYRFNGNKSIRITNKNGEGICVYDTDSFVNPIKDNQTNAMFGKQVDANLFEFIKNTLFEYNESKVKSKEIKLKKINHQNDIEYSLNEAHEFKIGLK